MSNFVFQPPKGLAWNIHKHPKFSTEVQTATSGRQVRAAFYQYPIWEYEMTWEYIKGSENAAIQTLNDLQSLMGFHGGRQGGFDSFLYSDPYDNSVAMMILAAAGDGSTTNFQLTRTLGNMTDIVQNVDSSVGPALIYKYDFQGIKNLLCNTDSLNGNGVNLVGRAQNWNPDGFGSGVTPTAAFGPDGSDNASKVFLLGTSVFANGGFLLQQADPTTGTSLPLGPLGNRTFTASVWLKADSPVSILLNLDSQPTNTRATFTCNVTAQWQRFSVTITYGSITDTLWRVFLLNQNSASTYVYAWGAQLEEGASPSAYQKVGSVQGGPTLQFSTPRTNNLKQSQSFGTSPWVVGSQITFTPNNIVAPDGTTTGTLATLASGAGGNNAGDAQSLTSVNAVYSFSLWVKAGTGTNGTTIAIGIFDGTASAWTTAGGAVLSGPGSASFNGSEMVFTGLSTAKWTKIYCYTSTIAASHSIQPWIHFGNATTTACTQYVWGAQLEANGNAVTPYIPTTSSTVTITDYSLGSTGIVTFGIPPAANALLAWTGNYYFRLRFLEDLLDFNEMMYQLWELKSLKMESVIQ